MTAQYNDLSNTFGFGSSTSPSYFTPSNNALDVSKAWGPSSNWSALSYDWSGKNPNNPDFTSMVKSQTFGEQQQPSARENYNTGLKLLEALPKALFAFGGQQNGYGNAASSGLSSGSGGVSTSGDLTFVMPQQQQSIVKPGQPSVWSRLAGVAAPLVGAAIGGPWGAAAGQALGASAGLFG
jgi:hypothetical protein